MALLKNSKSVRLSKAAREFNVGTGTIVDFLEKKGISVESSPNTKLEPEVYDLIVAEFDQERKVKAEAEKIGLSYKEHETVSIDSASKRKLPEEDESEELIIKHIGVGSKPPEEKVAAPAPEKVTKEEKAPPVAEKKAIETPPSPKEEKPEAKPEKEVVAEKAVSQKPEIAEETTPIEKSKELKETADKDKAEPEKPVSKEAEKAPEKASEVIASDQPKEEPKKEEKPAKKEAEADIPAEEPKASEPKVEPTAEKKDTVEPKEPASEEKPAAEKSTGPVVIGMIDLDTVRDNKPSRRSKKASKQQKSEKEERKAPETAKAVPPKSEEKAAEPKQEKAVEAVAEEKPATPEVKEEVVIVPVKKEDINFLKTEVQKLSGPTILGRINLEEIQKKERKPVASSTDDKVKAKKKRKRIRKPTDAAPAGAAAAADKSKKPNKDRRPGAGTAGGGRGQGTRREDRPSLTDEQIQKQIKETLANLTNKGSGKAKAIRAKRKKRARDEAAEALAQERVDSSTLRLTEFVTVSELASLMDVTPTDVIAKCMEMGLFVSINQRLDAETIQVVSDEFGYDVEFIKVDEVEEGILIEDDPSTLKARNPIVTVMGHVDHGKTKLLDYIRSANVVAGEAGGITQHIGAYEVVLEDGRAITFLDTPGHEAFTAMRARGAKVTDIAIIIIAADDAVMPQTVEAINHAKAAGVPIVIAINKIDRPSANPEKIREQLANMNILVEDWGGKYQCQEISAKDGVNIDQLLDKVLLEAEMLELKANPDRLALGTVIESSLDKGRGYVAKMLVQTGTIHLGDVVLAGSHYGRVKAMYNERNIAVKEAGPAAPVLMLGLNGAPQAGDLFSVKADEKEAKHIATRRQQLQREQGLRTKKHITLDEIGRRIAIGDFQELNIIVKGDVDGSVEALTDELLKLSTKEVQVNVIHKDVGAVKETDVMLASASNAVIVAFQVRPSVQARKLAEAEQIDIRMYSVIYDAVNEIKEAIAGMLSPKMVEKIVCNIEVRDVFKITKVGTIAGCYVLDGKVTRNTRVRVIRDGIVVYSGLLGSLKRFKDDVKEVSTGYECGLNIQNFNDIKVGDIVEGYEIVEESR